MKYCPFRACCDLCGDEGPASTDIVVAAWNAHSTIYCTNKEACADRIERNKRREAAARDAQYPQEAYGG